MAAARGARSTGSLKRAVSAHRSSPGRPCNLPVMADDIPAESTDDAHLISVVPASEVAQRSSPDLADGLPSLDDETADPKPSAGVVVPKGKGKRSILASPLKVAPKASAPAAAKDEESLTSSFQAKAFHHPVKKNNAFAETTSKWIIDPRHSKLMPRWDLTMVVALAFTAIVTPVEVAFYSEGLYITPMWVVNRIVDFCFIIDIVLTFNLAFQERPERGGQWVFNKRGIAYNYLTGWFPVDFLSVLPFWLVTLDKTDPLGLNVAEIDPAASTGTIARGAVLLRVVKLLRMLKLARVLKASRVMQRVLLDVVMNKWEWTYAVTKMIKLFVFLTLYAHWQACVWGVVSSYMQDEGYPNWIQAFHDQYRETHGVYPPELDVYIAALYWSVMTLTSIGYGEMTPVNTAERALCSVYMLFSGVMWTYAIGTVAAIATTLDPNAIAYQNTMDSLNYFMRERELPRQMRMALRDFFTNAKRVHQLNDDGDLLDRMSPLLQGTVALAANKKWLDVVWYFRGIQNTSNGAEFVASLAKALVIRSYVSHERLPVGQLYILSRGLVVKMWRFLGTGRVWGEDIILDSPELMDHSQAVALSYVEAYTLSRGQLEDCLQDFPGAQEKVRKAARKILIQRAFLKYLAIQTGKKGPVSFVTKSTANGFSVFKEDLSLEQKVDAIYEKSGNLGGAAGGGGGNVEREIANLKRDVAEIKQMMQQLLKSSS